MTIPTHLKHVVYYLGVDPDEVVSAKVIRNAPMTFALHLRKGDLEWRGWLVAPPYGPRPPVTRVEDLVNDTADCPRCNGSGKVRK